MVPQSLVAPCNGSPQARWSQLSGWTQVWGLVIPSQYSFAFSALQQFLSITEREESPARRGVRGSTIPCTSLHPVPPGCSEACFAIAKSRWEMTAWDQGRVRWVLVCWAAAPPCFSPGTLEKAWVNRGTWKKCQFDFYCIWMCNKCFTGILDKHVMSWTFFLMKLRYLSNLKTLCSNKTSEPDSCYHSCFIFLQY